MGFGQSSVLLLPHHNSRPQPSHTLTRLIPPRLQLNSRVAGMGPPPTAAAAAAAGSDPFNAAMQQVSALFGVPVNQLHVGGAPPPPRAAHVHRTAAAARQHQGPGQGLGSRDGGQPQPGAGAAAAAPQPQPPPAPPQPPAEVRAPEPPAAAVETLAGMGFPDAVVRKVCAALPPCTRVCVWVHGALRCGDAQVCLWVWVWGGLGGC